MKLFNQKLQYYLFFILAFVLPIHGRLVPPVIALILLSWLLEFNFKEKYIRIRNSRLRKSLLSFSILYLLYLVGTLYSSQLHGQEGAFFDLEVKLSLLIFPLLFSSIDFKPFGKDFYNHVLAFFVLGSLLIGVLLLGLSFIEYLNNGRKVTTFFYVQLSQWIHPGYLSLYFAFSIAILIAHLVSNSRITRMKKAISFVIILFFQLLIILLSSKAGILATAVMYLVVLIYFLVKGNLGLANRFWVPSVFIVSFFLTLLLFPQSYSRFINVKKSIEQKESINKNTLGSSAARILVWESGFEVIKKNPFIGVGTGDVKQELLKIYKEKMIGETSKDYLNAHNQFIQTTIALGFTGLIVLLLYFFIPIVYSFRKNSLIYLSFLILVGFHFLVESMLERQAGVVFYAFFNSLLFFFSSDKRGSS